MADELLIKYLLQETSKAENLQVRAWLKYPANLNHFQQFEQVKNKNKMRMTDFLFLLILSVFYFKELLNF